MDFPAELIPVDLFALLVVVALVFDQFLQQMLRELIALCFLFRILFSLILALSWNFLFFLFALDLRVLGLFLAGLLRFAALNTHFLEVDIVAFDFVLFKFEVFKLL